MGLHNYDRHAQELGDYVESLGYDWKVEHDSKHPRFRFGTGDCWDFIPLSSTTSYDRGHGLEMNKSWIRKKLQNMPAPVKAEQPEQRSMEVKITPDMAKAMEDAKNVDLNKLVPAINNPHGEASPYEIEQAVSYPIKIWTFGRGDGALAFGVPKAVVEQFPTEERRATILYTKDKCFGLYFGRTGTEPSRATNPHNVSYSFRRETVPFEFAARLSDVPSVLMKRFGHTLRMDGALPSFITNGFISTKSSGTSLIQDGIAAKNLLNEWLRKASKAGLEPHVTWDAKLGEIAIEIAEKKSRSL